MIHLSSYKDIVKSTVYTSIGYSGIRIAIIDENRFIFLIPADKSVSHEKNIELIRGYFKELYNKLERKVKNISLTFGISDINDTIFEIKRNYLRCEKTITNGKLLYPEKNYLSYSDLGAFAWMDIQEDEIEMMLNGFKRIICSR